MDDLAKVCREIEKCKRERVCYGDPIVCTKKMIEKYADGNRDKYLTLKALIRKHNRSNQMIYTLLSIIVAMVSMVFEEAGGGFQIDILYKFFQIYALGAIIIFLWGICCDAFTATFKWIEYVDVVLDDLLGDK